MRTTASSVLEVGRHGGSERSSKRSSALIVQTAARLGRDSAFYTVVTGVAFPLALVTAVIVTDYLSTAQYGQLAVLFFISGMLSVVINLFFLRGTERTVWGGSEEGVDVDTAELLDASERPRALGSGLMLSFVIGALLMAAVIPLAPSISQLLLHTRHLATAVIWTAASGALGSTWRLAANIGRWERRRISFGTVWVLRPLLALAFTWPLLAAHRGVTGAMAAVALGTLVSLLIGLALARRSYEVAFERSALYKIGRSSADFAAMMIGLYVLHNGDVYLLSWFVPSSQVGVYKLATNISSIVSYAVSAFLMAWAPLEFSTLFRAAYERYGRERLRGQFTDYYVIVGVFMVLSLSALAIPLVGLFASRYNAASGYVAISGVGYLAYGMLLVVARGSSFPHRYLIYGIAALAAGAGLVVTSVILAPPLGGYGVAIGDVVGGLVGVLVIVACAARWGELPRASLVKIAIALVLGGGCYLLGKTVGDRTGPFSPVLKVVSIFLFPLGLWLTGVIPRDHWRALWAVARASIRSRANPEELIARTATLAPVERAILVEIARDGSTPARVSALTGLSEAAVRLKLVAALRQLAGAGAPDEDDADLAAYLLDAGSVTARDALAQALVDNGVEPLALHQIDSTFETLRRASTRSWPMNGPYQATSTGTDWRRADAVALTLLDEVIRGGRPREEVAAELGMDVVDVDRKLIGALRDVSGEATHHPADALIGAFLLNGDERPPARQLWAAGVDPLDLHRLELMITRIRTLPRFRWRRIRTEARVVQRTP